MHRCLRSSNLVEHGICKLLSSIRDTALFDYQPYITIRPVLVFVVMSVIMNVVMMMFVIMRMAVMFMTFFVFMNVRMLMVMVMMHLTAIMRSHPHHLIR